MQLSLLDSSSGSAGTKDSPCFIFDLDGTLADASHRMHYIQTKPKRWDLFFRACIDDKPIKDVIDMYFLLQEQNYALYIVSGRSDSVRDLTVDWLAAQCIYPTCLYMRRSGDYRPDWIVKQEILNEWFDISRIRGVFDDRDQVVRMWRRNGLRCYQVADGNF